MTSFTAISVDDEPSAHDVLRALLKNVEGVELAATFTIPDNALIALGRQTYDILFLDVAMPGMSGLDMLEKLSDPPVTVLLTAHMTFALRAFELGVRDYLLKPVSAERLRHCLDNIRPLLEAGRRSGKGPPARLSLKCGSGHCFIAPLTTTHVEAAGNFSVVHTMDGSIFVSESLKDLQRRLEPFGFLRVHKSHLVNTHSMTAASACEIELNNGKRLPLGRAYRHTLKSLTPGKS